MGRIFFTTSATPKLVPSKELSQKTIASNRPFSSIEECLPKHRSESESENKGFSNINQVASLIHKKEVSHTIILQNVHLNLPNGKILRLHLIPQDEDKINKWQLKTFTVDEEDLPIPLEIAEEYKALPALDAFEELKKLGEIFYSEIRYSSQFADGSSQLVTEENGKISEIQYFTSNSMLGCTQSEPNNLNCKCIR